MVLKLKEGYIDEKEENYFDLPTYNLLLDVDIWIVTH